MHPSIHPFMLVSMYLLVTRVFDSYHNRRVIDGGLDYVRKWKEWRGCESEREKMR